MKPDRSFRSRIAHALFRHAQVVMPLHRRDWLHAMRDELEHVDEHHVLSWSIGCVVTCYIERINIMNRSSFIISRWLLAVEALVCLTPATMLWIFAMLNMNSLMHKQLMVASLALMLIVPVNLWFALRFITTQRPLHYKVHVISALLLAAYAVLQVAGMQGLEREVHFAWFQLDSGLILMFFILPALCCWHLSLFARDKPAKLQ